MKQLLIVLLLVGSSLAYDTSNLQAVSEQSVVEGTIRFTTSLDLNGCSTATTKTYAALQDKLFICYTLPLYSNWTLSNPQITLTGTNLNFPMKIDAALASQGVAVYEFSVPFVYSNVNIGIQVTASLLTQEIRTQANSTINFLTKCASTTNCVSTISTTVGFSTSLSTAGCANATASPNATLTLNQNVYICVSIATNGFGLWNLTTPIIYIAGNSLNYVVPFTSSSVNTVTAPGLAVYKFQVPFVYNDVVIKVANTAFPPTSRLLDTSTAGTPAFGSSGLLRFTCNAGVTCYGYLLAVFAILTLLC